MASKTTVHYIDDIDGADAAGTTSFSLEGVSYEIDLSSDNLQALADALAPYISAGRTVGKSKSRTAGKPKAPKNELTAQIRTWAKESGLEINDRGRVPNSVVEAYTAAH